jgi:NADH-quinone oxidoreductase subunit M
MSNPLVWSILVPLLGAGLIWTMADFGQSTVRRLALLVSLIALAIAGYATFSYPGQSFDFDRAWLGDATGIDVRFSVGLDGLSLWLYGLSGLLVVTAILVSWTAISDRPATFYALLLLLLAGMLGVFIAKDIILFYVFFEFTLIPLFFLIGIWGSEQRRYAAVKFFLFTFAGSVLTFLSLLAIVLWDYYHGEPHALRFSIPALTESLRAHPIDPQMQFWIFLGLFAGFAIKVPLFPLHTWLPLAHVQAPTAGSVLLAGVLLKIGTYGFVRFSLSFLPEATAQCAVWILWLSVAGIIYGALVALAQGDIKKLIAYSSVSHLGFCMLGLFALNKLGMQGAVLQMINHGLSTGGLFALVGMIYERYHTREIRELGGLARRMPWLATAFVLFTMSSIGLPGLNGFAGEFLLLAGAFQRGWADAPATVSDQLRAIAVISVLGVVLGAWYMLWLVQRVLFGPLHEGDHAGDHDHDHPPIQDMSWREVASLAPLVVFMVWIGVAPQFFLERIAPTVDPLTVTAGQAFDAHYQPVQVADEATLASGEMPRVD